MEKKGQSSCESCLYFEYDEEYDEYSCVMMEDMDEDDYGNFITGRTKSCPFYRFGDEYLIVHKQI